MLSKEIIPRSHAPTHHCQSNKPIQSMCLTYLRFFLKISERGLSNLDCWRFSRLQGQKNPWSEFPIDVTINITIC